MPERFKPKRRNVDVSGPGTCVDCERYTKIPEGPCLWKLEAQIDAIQRHADIALSLMRKITAQQRKLVK